MWYIIWILGTLFACCFTIIVALAIEFFENNIINKTKNINKL
ncbi:MAG: hypothetical protein ArsCj_0160 [Arsenophonus endosymbiont of Ceratovacuna japonica]